MEEQMILELTITTKDLAMTQDLAKVALCKASARFLMDKVRLLSLTDMVWIRNFIYL